MTKPILSIALLCAVAAVSACDKSTSKATPERLSALLGNGIPDEKQVKLDEKLAKTLARENSIAGLNADFGQDALVNPEAVDLSTLLTATLQRNPDIGRAAQEINRADARRLNAIFGYLPQVSASYTQTQLDQNVVDSDNDVFELGRAKYPVTNIGVSLTQPIFDMSRIYGIQLASTVRSNAEVSYIAAVQAALYSTFDAYLQASQSKSALDALRQRGQLVSRQLNSETGLADSGLTDEQTARSLAAELARISGDASIEESRYADALSKLSFMTGTAISGVKPGTMPRGIAGTERKVTAEEAIAAAEKNNPALVSVAIAVVERDITRKQAIAADFMPVLNAFATLEKEDRAASRFGGGSVTQDTSVGVKLTLPILNASGRGYATLETNVDLREALVTYHARRRQVATDINATLERMKNISAAIGSLSSAANSANDNADAESAKLETGDSTEVQLVARELLANQLSEQVQFQQMEYLRAWARLQFLTGAMSQTVGQ